MITTSVPGPRCLLLLLTIPLVAAGAAEAADPMAQRVLVIGVDGLSPAGVQQASTPVMDKLREQGAWTMHARSVMPTSSSSNWASMIMGAGPEQHGITSNDWQRDAFEIEPVARGPEGIFPTIFGAVRRQFPEAVIGVFHDWDDFGRLVERESCDVVYDGDGPVDTTQRAVAFIQEKRPTFTFVHLDHVDGAGHGHGWGSAEYLQAVGVADRLIGQLVEALEKAELRSETLILVTADHGGRGTRHGGNTMDEIEIPWIAVGPGVRRGQELRTPVNQYDTAATIAYALGVPQPDAWIARPVRSAFEPAAVGGAAP